MPTKILFAAFFCLMTAVFSAWDVEAKSYKDIFQIKDIKEDITSKTATAAKQKAFDDAQLKAVNQVIKSVVRKQDYEKAVAMPEDARQEMIGEVAVVNEKTTPTRYIGTLNVNLKPDKVAAYLSDSGIPYVQQVSEPVLILPKAPEYASITWETLIMLESEKSPLLDARFSSEYIDVANMTTVDLYYILERYNVKSIVIAELAPGSSEKMTVTLSRYAGMDLEEISAFSVKASFEGAVLEKILKPAAAYAVGEIEEDYKKRNVINMADKAKILIHTEIASLQNWLDIEKRMKKIPTIAEIDVKAMGSKIVYATVSYGNTIDALQIDLKKQRLLLEEEGENAFILKEMRP